MEQKDILYIVGMKKISEKNFLSVWVMVKLCANNRILTRVYTKYIS